MKTKASLKINVSLALSLCIQGITSPLVPATFYLSMIWIGPKFLFTGSNDKKVIISAAKTWCYTDPKLLPEPTKHQKYIAPENQRRSHLGILCRYFMKCIADNGTHQCSNPECPARYENILSIFQELSYRQYFRVELNNRGWTWFCCSRRKWLPIVLIIIKLL